MIIDQNVSLHPWETITELVGANFNNCLTMQIHRKDGDIEFDVADCGGVPHPRVVDTIQYLRQLYTIAVCNNPAASREAASFIFQPDDNPIDAPSVSWERQRAWSDVTLVPDIYYYHAKGYEDFLPEVIAWDDRADQLIWRGSTTGIVGLTHNSLESLLRYRLCTTALELGNYADCGFTNVVQGATIEENAAVKARLEREGLLRDFIDAGDMQRARYAIDIDGNANSWNFIQRLRIGACMLRVESPWHQWFEERLIAWRHYVPVAGDLSNLAERLEWCRTNPGDAREIARAGRAFAMQMRFDEEILLVARAVFPSSW